MTDKPILPAIVLLGAVLLLQVHGWQFWTTHVGAAGAAWSVLLEVVALWLWYQRSLSRRLLGLVASLLLLAGPLHLVTAPLFQGLAADERSGAARETETALLTAKVAQLETDLATYRRNSEARLGWLPAIQQAQAELDATRERLVALSRPVAASALPWQRQAVILMQAVALVLFQIAAVMAITTISRISTGMETPMETRREMAIGNAERQRATPRQLTAPATAQTSAATGLDVAEINRRLAAHLERTGQSQRAFADAHGYTTRDLSLVRTHERNVAEGKRTVPDHVLRRLAKQLGVIPAASR